MVKRCRTGVSKQEPVVDVIPCLNEIVEIFPSLRHYLSALTAQCRDYLTRCPLLWWWRRGPGGGGAGGGQLRDGLFSRGVETSWPPPPDWRATGEQPSLNTDIYYPG